MARYANVERIFPWCTRNALNASESFLQVVESVSSLIKLVYSDSTFFKKLKETAKYLWDKWDK